MTYDKTTQETPKKKFDFVDILKLVTAFGVIIPLLLGYFEYRRSVQQDIDKNYRDLVEKLSSEKKENRLAGATNLGTFIWKKEEYYNESIDILISAVALERDISVLNAIRSSLERVETKDGRKVLQQLLNLERNTFIFEQPLRKLGLQTELDQLNIQQNLVSSFISLFLSFTRNKPIDSLKFYQNSLNELAITDVNLIGSTIESSAISYSTILNTNFDKSRIINTVFTYSSFDNCRFSNCKISGSMFDQITLMKNVKFHNSEFDDVFFLGTDLTGADFTGVKGLKPIYFYGAYNLDNAIFDEEFQKELVQLENITEAEFTEYVYNSRLLRERVTDLLNLNTGNGENAIDEITQTYNY